MGLVWFAMYRGKIYSRHLFSYSGFNLTFTETTGWSTVLPNSQKCRFSCFNTLEAVIVLGLGELFRCLFCCSLEEYRVIHARPNKGCYMIPNNELVDSFIIAAIITSQLLCVRIFWSPAFLIPRQRSQSMARDFFIN